MFDCTLFNVVQLIIVTLGVIINWASYKNKK